MKNVTYIAADTDRQEYIIDMADTLRELCERLGLSYDSVKSMRSKGLKFAYITKSNGIKTKISIERIEFNNEEDDEG